MGHRYSIECVSLSEADPNSFDHPFIRLESIVSRNQLKTWIKHKLMVGKELLTIYNKKKYHKIRIRNSKTSKRYAQSVIELMKFVMMTLDQFSDISEVATDDMVEELADGLSTLIQDYTSLVVEGGNKDRDLQDLPRLKPLRELPKKNTKRCNNIRHNVRRGTSDIDTNAPDRHSKVRRTDFIRVNTLDYIICELIALQNSSTFISWTKSDCRLAPFAHHFDLARSAAQSAIQQVSEDAAFYLIFLAGSNYLYYRWPYLDDVANKCICPHLVTIENDIAIILDVLSYGAQRLVVKKVMKSSFDAFLLVLVAGRGRRSFTLSDHEIIKKDFKRLKKVFCTCLKGSIVDEVDREAKMIEGVIELMSQSTETLIEKYETAAWGASGLGHLGYEADPWNIMTGKWTLTETNTIFRILCYRNDEMAHEYLNHYNQYLKKSDIQPTKIERPIVVPVLKLIDKKRN